MWIAVTLDPSLDLECVSFVPWPRRKKNATARERDRPSCEKRAATGLLRRAAEDGRVAMRSRGCLTESTSQKAFPQSVLFLRLG
ncbi:hypothetical protein GWI33_019499 [Rhynchophorus ferrugineus]|uniref:Uncharacterized protein n=1 Tax=Rhynchophorus ferrugineus TaxID=354439 RepID=A0A834M0F9_RHYFE|nr:hypothetical protein GWI33_019499 [Rhynchophorus ferrugineus]